LGISVVATNVVDMARDKVYGEGDKGSNVGGMVITRLNAALKER
jgi:hypothetical protein